MRIKYIIPFPFDEDGIAARAAQIPSEILGADTEVECVPVRHSATLVDGDLVARYQVRPTRSQATSPGSHSVLILDISRVTSVEAHLGHGGAGLSEVLRNSSYRSPHPSHRYS
jgi:hypothetical protein